MLTNKKFKDIIKLRKINRYLFLEANRFLTDAYNTFDDVLLDKIVEDEELKNSIHETSSNLKSTMPKCTCCQNKTSAPKFPANYNVLDKCTCPQAHPPNLYKFRRVLASNKTYNYNAKLPEQKFDPKHYKAKCTCRKGNRCYCCFDSTDAEDIRDYNVNDKISRVYSPQQNKKQTNPTPKHSSEFCECDCDCTVENGCDCKIPCPKGNERVRDKRGKSLNRQNNNDEDEFILLVKDQDKRKSVTSKTKFGVGSGRSGDLNRQDSGRRYPDKSSRTNVNYSEKNTDRDYYDTTRGRTPRREVRNRFRSNSIDSVPTYGNADDVSPLDLQDINKFRDQYYFECHAIPKEQFYRHQRDRVKNQYTSKYSETPRDRPCNCPCKQAGANQLRDELQCCKYCKCQFCTCKKKPYQLDDYSMKNNHYDSDGEETAAEETNRSMQRSKKSLPKTVDDNFPNYTINIPEICFKFPINGGKIVIENQSEDPKSGRTQSTRNVDGYDYRRRLNENEKVSISLRDEQGFEHS